MTASLDIAGTDSQDDARRRRLRFRAWHRGTREMDLLLGRFADAHVDALSADEMAAFEELMDHPDPDLYAALTVRHAPDGAPDLVLRLRRFHKVDA